MTTGAYVEFENGKRFTKKPFFIDGHDDANDYDGFRVKEYGMQDENRQLIWTLTGISLALSVVQWYIGRKIAEARGK